MNLLLDDFEEDFGVVVSVWDKLRMWDGANVCEETEKPLFSRQWTRVQGQIKETLSVATLQLTSSDIWFAILQAFLYTGIRCCCCCLFHILYLIIFHIFTCCWNCNHWWSCQMFSVRNRTNECSNRSMSDCGTRFSVGSASSLWVIVAESTLSAVITVAACKSGKSFKTYKYLFKFDFLAYNMSHFIPRHCGYTKNNPYSFWSPENNVSKYK